MPRTRLRRSVHVSRAEVDELRDTVERNREIAERNRAEHEVEFKRIAEIQRKLDELEAIVKRLARLAPSTANC